MTAERKRLVKKLDRIFSEYIRLSAADDNGYVKCPTCGRVYYWRETDLSHYAGRQHLAVRWDERNVIAQCQSENRFQEGNKFKIRPVLVSRYGEEEIKQVEKLANTQWAEDIFSLQIKINEYKEKLKALKKERGNV